MPRLFGVGLSVLILVSTFVGQIVVARPAAAQSVTTTSNAELRSGPGYDHSVLSTVLAGVSLTIDGPPEAEFYPVTVNGQMGWIAGSVLNILKETTAPLAEGVGAATTESMAPVSGWDTVQVAQEAPLDEQAGTDAPVPADPAATAVPAADPPVDPSTSPAADTTAAPAAEATVAPGGETTAAPPADAAAAPPADSSAPPADTTVPAASPAAAAPDTATVVPAPPLAAEQPAEPAVTVVPETTPEPAPAATPAPATAGQASVPAGGNLFYAPDASSGVVFWVPAGSTVWRLGETSNGFAKADYMAMIGWIAADLLAAPVAVAAEIVPESAPAAENLRTPRPGSGVAFASVELTLRAGPSANQAALDVVPAGERVVMTGVMENGFHRVDYQGTLGWVGSDYLSTPPNPTATPSPTEAATGDGFDGSRYQRTYSRNEIVSIIHAAADRYGQSRSDMLRVAECESALDPYAVHPSGSYGLYQFIRTTWKSTPYGDQNVFDPKANSNAAAWMWSQGRRSEWVCK
ncbi:MAG: SH3 domain-containing protein [Chloroflexota bacterium]|nr:SH3 domain-containing protein [Chloroflexota bacterium]